MSKQTLIIAAVGEKDVLYGNNRGYLMPLVELIHSSKADTWTLTNKGAVLYFRYSRGALERIEAFFARVEALKEHLPSLRLGLARDYIVRRFDWFSLRNSQIGQELKLEQRALSNLQGPQTYSRSLEYMKAELGFGPLLELWRKMN